MNLLSQTCGRFRVRARVDHGYSDVIPVYFHTDYQQTAFFADNNIAYHTKYYLKPISQDEFTIHTLYPNDNNKVKFSTTDFVGSHDYKKKVYLVVLNKLYKHDKFDNTYNKTSKLTSNKTLTLNFDINTSDRLLSNIPPDNPPLIFADTRTNGYSNNNGTAYIDEEISSLAISSTRTNATEKPTGIGIDYDDNDEITVSYWFQFPENFNRDNGDYVMNSDYSVASNRYSFYFKDENGDDTIYFLNDPEINNHLQFKMGKHCERYNKT